MKSAEFVQRLIEIPQKYKTAYAKGTFGQKATNGTLDAKAKQYPGWYIPNGVPTRLNKLKALPDDTRLFDCCGLVKAVAWNFPNTVYTSNGVKDYSDQTMWEACTDKSQSFTQIQPGELLWMQGHVGVYIGEGKAIECTGSWEAKVMITCVQNMGTISGLHARRWTGHGKLPFIEYTGQQKEPTQTVPDYSKYPVLKFTKDKRGRYTTRGEYVKILQRLLIAKGYDPKGVDGIFGPGCNAAVLRFQKENTDTNGKKLEVDGCVGPKTWGALYK